MAGDQQLGRAKGQAGFIRAFRVIDPREHEETGGDDHVREPVDRLRDRGSGSPK
jgi:hypothetical protein